MAVVVLLAIPVAIAAYISPDVNVSLANMQPDVQPTPPAEVNTDDKLQREVWEQELAEIKLKLADPNLSNEQRAALRRQAETVEVELKTLEKRERIALLVGRLKEIAAMQDPSLSDERRSELAAAAEKIKEELNRLKIVGVEWDNVSVRGTAEGLKEELDKIKAARQDPNLTEAQKYELSAREARISSQLSVLATGRLRPIVVDLRERNSDGDDEWDLPADMDADMDTPRSRGAMERLKKEACITDEEAAAKALAAYPGKLFDKELGQINGEVTWRFYIVDGAATPDSNTLLVHVSAIDGRIIKATRAHVTVSFDAKHPGEIVKKARTKKPE
jgi:uncharacterized membrane protein YkoI